MTGKRWGTLALLALLLASAPATMAHAEDGRPWMGQTFEDSRLKHSYPRIPTPFNRTALRRSRCHSPPLPHRVETLGRLPRKWPGRVID